MRIVFSAIIILTSFKVRAQYDQQHAFKLQAHISYGLPLGNYNDRNSNSLFAGKAKTISGGTIAFIAPVYKRLFAGVYIRSTGHNTDNKVIENQLFDHYYDENYYIVVSRSRKTMGLLVVSLDFNYNFKLPFAEVEPHIGIGVGGMTTNDYAEIERKRKNDNYRETIDISATGNPTLIAIAGVNAQFKIFKWLYAVADIYYTYANVNLVFNERIETYLNERKEGSLPSSRRTFKSIRGEIGLQFRMWNSHAIQKHKKINGKP